MKINLINNNSLSKLIKKLSEENKEKQKKIIIQQK